MAVCTARQVSAARNQDPRAAARQGRSDQVSHGSLPGTVPVLGAKPVWASVQLRNASEFPRQAPGRPSCREHCFQEQALHTHSLNQPPDTGPAGRLEPGTVGHVNHPRELRAELASASPSAPSRGRVGNTGQGAMSHRAPPQTPACLSVPSTAYVLPLVNLLGQKLLVPRWAGQPAQRGPSRPEPLGLPPSKQPLTKAAQGEFAELKYSAHAARGSAPPPRTGPTQGEGKERVQDALG